MSSNSKSATLVASGDGEDADLGPTGVSGRPADVHARTVGRRRGALDLLGPDGLPMVLPEHAAERAFAYIEEQGYGPKTEELILYIAARAAATADLNVVIMERLAEQLENAQTLEEILMPFEPDKGEQYIGKPLYVLDAEFVESDYDAGFPYYCTLRAQVVGSQEERNITVGGVKVVMQVATFDRKNAWPAAFVIHRSTKPTKAGFYPLELRLAA